LRRASGKPESDSPTAPEAGVSEREIGAALAAAGGADVAAEDPPPTARPTLEEERVLVTLRRIMRAMDLHSRRLIKTAGLTAPQLLLLRSIDELGAVSISRLSGQMNLSQATVTTILDRLSSRGLVGRRRSEADKRIVHAFLTDAGRRLLADAPPPLQDLFSTRFRELPDWEQSMIIAALQRVAGLMDAQGLDAAPMLHIGEFAAPGPSGSD